MCSSRIDRNFRWYYVYNSQSSSIEFNCMTQNLGYSCSNESQTIHSINKTIVRNLMLLGMQRRSVVEYLVSQTIMVIMYIGVMKMWMRL